MTMVCIKVYYIYIYIHKLCKYVYTHKLAKTATIKLIENCLIKSNYVKLIGYIKSFTETSTGTYSKQYFTFTDITSTDSIDIDCKSLNIYYKQQNYYCNEKCLVEIICQTRSYSNKKQKMTLKCIYIKLMQQEN